MTDTNFNIIREILETQNLTTDELLKVLLSKNVTLDIYNLMRVGRSLGIGLARDGKWYRDDQNAEVRDAIEKNTITHLMEQYLRNRH